MRTLRIEPEVYDDLSDAAAWYDTKQRGVSARFLAAMYDLMAAIGERPLSYPIEHGRVRVAWRKPFPYKVYYLVEDEVVSIFAVIHAVRHSSTWRTRIAEEE